MNQTESAIHIWLPQASAVANNSFSGSVIISVSSDGDAFLQMQDKPPPLAPNTVWHLQLEGLRQKLGSQAAALAWVMDIAAATNTKTAFIVVPLPTPKP